MLLAASSESDWLRCWYAEVVPLCWNRYRRVQKKRAPRPEDPHQTAAGSGAVECDNGGKSPL
jgi:hypothetical protein